MRMQRCSFCERMHRADIDGSIAVSSDKSFAICRRCANGIALSLNETTPLGPAPSTFHWGTPEVEWPFLVALQEHPIWGPDFGEGAAHIRVLKGSEQPDGVMVRLHSVEVRDHGAIATTAHTTVTHKDGIQLGRIPDFKRSAPLSAEQAVDVLRRAEEFSPRVRGRDVDSNVDAGLVELATNLFYRGHYFRQQTRAPWVAELEAWLEELCEELHAG